MTEFHKLRIRERIEETPDTVTLVLDVPAELSARFAYKPGQYLTIEWSGKKGAERRAYSLSSAPWENRWAITVKKQPKGTVSRFLTEKANPDDILLIQPPQGKFCIQPDPDRQRHYGFVAAGSGITPVFSMIKAILEEEPMSVCHLLYGSRAEDDIIFRDTLNQLAKRYSGQLFVTYVLSRPIRQRGFRKLFSSTQTVHWTGLTGRIDRDKLEHFITEAGISEGKTHWYLCGPAPMMELCMQVLKEAGVTEDQIFREYYDSVPIAGAAAGRQATLTAMLNGQEISVNVIPGQTLLEALLQAGHDAPWSCSSGACASCMARLLDGEVDMPHAPALDPSEINDGYILTCQSRPRSETLRIEY